MQLGLIGHNAHRLKRLRPSLVQAVSCRNLIADGRLRSQASPRVTFALHNGTATDFLQVSRFYSVTTLPPISRLLPPNAEKCRQLFTFDHVTSLLSPSLPSLCNVSAGDSLAVSLLTTVTAMSYNALCALTVLKTVLAVSTVRNTGHNTAKGAAVWVVCALESPHTVLQHQTVLKKCCS
jgi:hypothetical protein